MMEDPDIQCQRCKNYGAVAYRGWEVLCQKCIDAEESFYYEDKNDR